MLIARDTDPGLAEELFPGERCQLLRCTEGKLSSDFPGSWIQREEEKEERPTGQGGGAARWTPRAQIRHDTPRRRVNKAETCLLGTLAPHRGARPRTEAPGTSLKVAGISPKTPENVGADWPPLFGWSVAAAGDLDTKPGDPDTKPELAPGLHNTEEWVRGTGTPSPTLADGEGLPAEAHDLS